MRVGAGEKGKDQEKELGQADILKNKTLRTKEKKKV